MIDGSRTRKVHFRPSPPPSPDRDNKGGSTSSGGSSNLWGRGGYISSGNNHHSTGSSSSGNNSNNAENSSTSGPSNTSRLRLLLTLVAIIALSYVTIVNMFHRSLDVTSSADNNKPATSLRGKAAPLPDVAITATTAGIPVTLAVRPIPLPSSSHQQMSSTISATNTNVKSYKKLDLLSKGRPVTASVHGQLGPPSVITNESIANWLTDRWQAALNMKGEPIPGEHWVEIDLQRPCRVEKVIIDWEDAYSTFWTLEGRLSLELTKEGPGKPLLLGTGAESKQIRRMKHHVVYEMHTAISRDQGRIREKTRQDYKAAAQQSSSFSSSNEQSSSSTSTTNAMKDAVRYVRLTIHKPSEHWGSSIWRLQLWGTAAEDASITASNLSVPPNQSTKILPILPR